MVRRTALYILFIVGFVNTIYAQQFVRGRIYDKNKDRVLASVTARNFSQNILRQSDFGGNYQIKAGEGDTLIFSSAGYLPDTLKVTSFMLSNRYDISLLQNPEILQSVTVGEYSNYQLDSLNRREEYRRYFEIKNTKLTGDYTPLGFGLTLSPVSFFNRKEKQKRKFKSRIVHNEEQYYVDSRFSPTLVMRLTGLQGNELHLFMLNNRPTYKFCRKSSQEDMLFYINDRLKVFLKDNVHSK